MIGIIDYGLGNINAFCNVYRHLNLPVTAVRTAGELAGCDHLILPGVGAFDNAIGKLDASGMRQAITRRVTEEKVPILGVCVGMQMLADASEEGRLPGLGWIPGTVKRFDPARIAERTKLPHMGWNNVRIGDSPLFRGLEQDSRFYFIHSYYFVPDDPAHSLARSAYGGDFASAVGRNNIFGVQFHPEKSHAAGIVLLKNFAEL